MSCTPILGTSCMHCIESSIYSIASSNFAFLLSVSFCRSEALKTFCWFMKNRSSSKLMASNSFSWNGISLGPAWYTLRKERRFILPCIKNLHNYCNIGFYDFCPFSDAESALEYPGDDCSFSSF
jgi:hypothetical protein